MCFEILSISGNNLASCIPSNRNSSKIFFLESAQQGLLILVAGANVLRFAPALNISDDLIEQAMLKLKQVVRNIVHKDT